MSGSKGADVDDQDAADAANQEVLVLDRLVYRNRSQHRNAKYFTLALEVRRACRIFAAPHVPELLAKCLGILARVPDSRNGRAREAWVRSAAAALQRMSAAAVACAEVLEATAQASKHLAHQVSQTYFMALSVVFLACLARLFVCSLHLGGRLVEVHGALLRTLLAQPSTSECLPAAALAACRIPEETATFLFRLRGAGRSTMLRGGKAPGRAAAAAATAAAAASAGEVLGATPVESSMSAPIPTIGNTGGKGGAVVEGRGEVGGASGGNVIGADDDGDDSDDTGVRIGRVVATDQVENRPSAGKVFRAKGVAMVGQGGKRGKVESDAARTGDETKRGGRSGGDGRTRNRDRGFKPPRKKVVLASEFSDSSDNESDNSTTKPYQQQQRQPQRSAAAAAAATSPIRAETSRRASPEEVPSVEHVGWMIDRGPACVASPPRCTNGREDDAAPSSSSSSSSPLAVATSAATSPPQGEDASLRTPGAQRGVTDGVAEGSRGRMNGFPVGVKTSSKEHQSVENGARAADANTDVPKASLTRETAGEEAHVSEGPAISCVAGVEASGGVAGDPPPPLVDLFGSSSAVEAISSYSSATGETQRVKKGRKGKQQAMSKRKRPPSSLPAPSKSTPSAVEGGGGYDRKAAAPSKAGRASEEAVSDCRRSVVRGSRGEGVDGEIMMLAAEGDMEKQKLGGIGSPESVSLPPEPALLPGAVTVRAAVDTAASTTEVSPPAAPSCHHKVDEKGSENVGGSSLPPTKLLQQRGRASTKERSNPTNSGAGNTRDGGGSGAKRSLAGEARGEMTNRKKKKKSKKASKGATKRSAGGQGGDGNAIDDIFGSFS